MFKNFSLKNLNRVREFICTIGWRRTPDNRQGIRGFKRYLKTLSNYDLEYTIEVRLFKNALVSLKH